MKNYALLSVLIIAIAWYMSGCSFIDSVLKNHPITITIGSSSSNDTTSSTSNVSSDTTISATSSDTT